MRAVRRACAGRTASSGPGDLAAARPACAVDARQQAGVTHRSSNRSGMTRVPPRQQLHGERTIGYPARRHARNSGLSRRMRLGAHRPRPRGLHAAAGGSGGRAARRPAAAPRGRRRHAARAACRHHRRAARPHSGLAGRRGAPAGHRHRAGAAVRGGPRGPGGRPALRDRGRALPGALDAAQASLQRAEATVGSAQSRFERQQELVRGAIASRQAAEDAAAALAQAQADREAARANVEAARINLANATIRSPIDGRADRSTLTPGALVSANQAAALTTVRTLDPMNVDLTGSTAALLNWRRAVSEGRLTPNGERSKVRLKLENGFPIRTRARSPSRRRTSARTPAPSRSGCSFPIRTGCCGRACMSGPPSRRASRRTASSCRSAR